MNSPAQEKNVSNDKDVFKTLIIEWGKEAGNELSQKDLKLISEIKDNNDFNLKERIEAFMKSDINDDTKKSFGEFMSKMTLDADKGPDKTNVSDVAIEKPSPEIGERSQGNQVAHMQKLLGENKQDLMKQSLDHAASDPAEATAKSMNDGLSTAVNSIANVAGKMATGGLGVAAATAAATARLFKKDENTITAESKAFIEGHHKSMNDRIENMSNIADKIKESQPGKDRDKLVQEFVSASTEAAKGNQKYASDSSEKSSDPNRKGRYHESEEDIVETSEKNSNKMESIVNKVHDSLNGDQKNQDTIKKHQSKIQEILESIKNMVKTMFSGNSSKKSGAGMAPG